MTLISEIHDKCLKHAYQCDSLKFSIEHSASSLHNKIVCECGFECDLPFSAALECPDDFQNFCKTVPYWNSPVFAEIKEKSQKKRKEEETISRNLKRLGSAIGSLEV